MPSWTWLLLAGVTCALPGSTPAASRLRGLTARSGAGGRLPPPRGWGPRPRPGERITDGLAGDRQRRTALWSLAVVAAALVTLASGRLFVGLAAAVIVVAAGTVVCAALVARLAERRRRALRAALALLDAELSAGAREADALHAAAAVAGESGSCLREAAAVARGGGDVSPTFAAGGPQFAPLAAAWHVRSSCGAALAEIVGKVEHDLAAGDARRREADAALAGPRSSAALLSGLPVLGVALGSVVGAHPLHLLCTTGPGSMLLLVGVLLDAAGLLWMQRLVRSGADP